MDTKETTFANELGRTILPREGIGAYRIDERPTLQAYDLTAIPRRQKAVRQKPVAVVRDKPVYEKKQKSSLFGRKTTQDPFLDRLSRLS